MYPFGMQMPSRSYSSNKYRYGFNGKEKDKDLNSLTAYDYGFRIYNPAIGKFLSVDPLAQSYPWNSVYAYAEGDPVNCIDLDGLEKVYHYAITSNKLGDHLVLTNPLSTFSNSELSTFTLSFKGHTLNSAFYSDDVIGRVTSMCQVNKAYENLKGSGYALSKKMFFSSNTLEEFNVKVESFWNDLHNQLVLLTEGQRDMANENLMNFSFAYWGMYGSLYSSVNAYNKGKLSTASVQNNQAATVNGKPQVLDTKGKVNSQKTAVHSEYPDGKKVFEGEQPGKVLGPGFDEITKVKYEFPHTVLKWDPKNGRIYKATTFGYNFKRVMDIDFTIPTYPNGTRRPLHFVPEQHVYIENPSGGTPKRGKGEPLNLGFNFDFSINHILD